MSTLSTTNLLQAVNRVLLNVGEREQRQLNTPTSYLARECLKDALEELTTQDDWEWSRETVTPPATDWTANVVRLTRLHRLHSVGYKDATLKAYVDVPFTEEQRFDSLQPPPAAQRTPCVFTQLTDTTFKFDVTPTAVETALFKFYVTKRSEMPLTETTPFNISEQGIPMLVSLASAKFAQRHTGENGNAQMFLNEAQRQVEAVRNHKRFRPSRPFNMYRSH